MGFGFLVNCFQRFSPVLFLEEDLSWGASNIFQVQARTKAKAETTTPLPRLPPSLRGSCSSSAHKGGRRGAQPNHHSQEALPRRNEPVQLPMATVAVPPPPNHQCSLCSYLCLFLAPRDDAVFSDWLWHRRRWCGPRILRAGHVVAKERN